MKKLLILIIPVLFFVKPLLVANAATDCSLSSFAPGTRDLTTCVGGFTSEAELRNTTVQIECLANSNIDPYAPGAPPLSTCINIQNPTYSLRNAQVAQDSRDLYYSCTTAQGLNRAIGLINVHFVNSSGAKMCSINKIVTKPYDWNSLTEGKPWLDTGTNQPHQFMVFCDSDRGVNTAIGCIPTDPQGFVAKLLGFGVGMAGGIAFLLIILGGFQILTSAGNPERLQGGRELVGAAISGLLLIIFSLFLLRLIGFNILGIPDFG